MFWFYARKSTLSASSAFYFFMFDNIDARKLVFGLLLVFPAVTAATLMPVAGRLGLTAQGFQLVPGFEHITVIFAPVACFLGLELYQHDIAQGVNIQDFAFAVGCDHAFVAFGQLLAG